MHTNYEKTDNEKEDWNRDEMRLIDDLLKESLRTDFLVLIPENFADKITEKVEKRKSVKEALLQMILMTLGYISILCIAFGLLYYIKSAKVDVILDFIFTYKFPILFGIVCILSIQLADVLLLSRTKDQLDE